MLDRVVPLSETDLGAWLSKYPYNPKVFVLPPWEAIYANDAERDQTFEQAEAVDKDVQEWYRRCHYQVLEVPRAAVAERCDFVLEALSGDGA